MADLRPLILLVEDDPGAALLQRRRLERANFRVAQATNFEEASTVLSSEPVQLVLMDYRLGATSGLEVHRRLKAAGFDVPVIVVSGAIDDATVIEAMRAGVRDVVVKDTEYLDYLPEAVRGVVNQAAAAAEWRTQERVDSTVLIVEDDVGVATLQRRRLERAGYKVEIASTADAALEFATGGDVNMLVLDWRLSGTVTGLDVYEALKTRGLNIPAILVTAFADQDVAIRALRAGVRDFVPKSVDYLDYLPTAVDRVAAQVRVERKLVESELRFASIIGTTMDAVLMSDDQARIVLFNRAAEEMFECTASEALQLTVQDLVPALASNKLNEERGNVKRRLAVDAVTSTGRRIPIEVSLNEIPAHGNRFFTIIARDISERLRTEAQLREADRRKDEFLGMLAHELRNPVAAIMNASEVLNRTSTDSSSQKLAGIVRRQTASLSRMVDDLLDVSRVTLGKIQITKETLRLEQILQRSVDNIRDSASRAGLQLHVELGADAMWLSGDATRLEQVFANLLSNAVKFTVEGGSITVRASRRNGSAVVSVRDTGMGMNAELLPKVFELFVQGDTSLDRSKSGLGIGLALVKKLVTLHGGTVQAHSGGPQQGSEFIVTLPLQSHAPPTQEPRPSNTRAVTGLRVLVVDDQRDIADSVASLLRSCGHHVDTVYDGREAFRRCKAQRPDVMLIDVGMPEVTGYDLAQEVRSEPELAGVKLIALTGYGREEDRKTALEAGFDLHLTKPVTSSRLQDAFFELISH